MTTNFCLIYNEIVPKNSNTGAILIGKKLDNCFFEADSITTLFFSLNGTFIPTKQNKNKHKNYLKLPIVFTKRVFDAYSREELEEIRNSIISALTFNRVEKT